MSEVSIDRIIQGPILQCPPETPIGEAAQRMYAAKCSSIIVMDAGKAVGIWTEKDVLAIPVDDARILDRPIVTAMRSPVVTISGSALIRDATQRMKEKCASHLIVVAEEGSYLGVITQTNIVLNQGIGYFLHLRDVASVMARSIRTIDAGTSVAAAADQMRECGLDAVAVNYADGSTGILTERDIVRLLCEDGLDATVGEVASRPIHCVAASTSLYHARNVLAERQIRHLGVVDDDGRLVGLLAFSDIINSIELGYVQELEATLRSREEALTLSRGKLRLCGQVFESSSEGIVITDAAGVVLSANPAFLRLIGYEEHELVGRNVRVLSSGRHNKDFFRLMWNDLKQNGYWKGELWNRRKNGEVYLKMVTITGIKSGDGKYSNFAAVHSDPVSHEVNAERIHYLANHDPLTGLPNRNHFMDRLIRAVTRGNRQQKMLAVIIFDLDRFKLVNASFGYPSGDELLQAVAAMLSGCGNDNAVVARLNADEFAILLEDIESADDAAGFAERVQAAASQPLTVKDNQIYVTASVGISLYPNDGREASELLQKADTALGQAKSRGRGIYEFFHAEVNQRTRERLSLAAEIRHALGAEEFRVHYQPKVSLSTLEVTGMEALVRWRHPVRGLIPPAEFIAVAEEVGLISEINDWVLKSSCCQLRRWLDDGLPPLSLAVNLSGCQFHQTGLAGTIRRVLERNNLPAACLELEITESMAMEDVETAIRSMNELAASGISVAIDDFGIGYSSFAYLKRFPVRTLKIDKSFTNDDDPTISRAIIAMAHSLGMKVVAEGIETPNQLQTMRECGCDIGQGYLFGHPLSADLFAERFPSRSGRALRAVPRLQEAFS